jgi:hypothetical protein
MESLSLLHTELLKHARYLIENGKLDGLLLSNVIKAKYLQHLHLVCEEKDKERISHMVSIIYERQCSFRIQTGVKSSDNNPGIDERYFVSAVIQIKKIMELFEACEKYVLTGVRDAILE